jgi:hypothetical protein
MSLAAPHRPRLRTLEAGEVAWVALIPCAAAILAAIVVLGPPLGHVLRELGPQEQLWPREAPYVFGHPEPVKHARFAIALLGPALLALLVLGARRRPVRLDVRTVRVLVVTAELLTVAFVVVAVLGQNSFVFPFHPRPWVVLHAKTLAGGPLLALLVLGAMRVPAVARWSARVLPVETRPRRAVCLALAALATIAWLLMAVNTDGTIGNAAFPDLPPWAMGDTLAIVDGRVPLVNFYVLYGLVWAYVAALPLYLFGVTIAAFSIAMTSVSALALLALYAVLRRVARSSLLALALYLPTLATGFLSAPHLPERPENASQVFSVWPMRYAGPYLLAWLTARHIDGASPRRAWPLFLVGGLVVVNNLEFGAGALLATTVAVVLARPPRSRAAVARLARGIAGGLLGALALVAAVTLARSGQLPKPGYLFEYPRTFGAMGLTAEPMPTAGLHLALYATFVAAIGTAVVRAARGERDRLLTSMLAWSGIFGLLAGSYFAGRSDIWKLTALFSAWAFALALLTIVVVGALAARSWRRPRIAELLVLAGFGVAAGSLHSLPAPWTQLARLRDTTSPPLYAEAAPARFIGARTHPGERVAILVPMGDRVARQLGLADVSPYAFIETLVSRRQWRKLIAAMRRERARALFAPSDLLVPAQRRLLARAGFVQRASGSGVVEWRDRR